MLTDAELAALESRLAPVLAAQGGRGVVDRHDVLALLAEVRRLRQPPDADGLLPAAEVEAVRTRHTDNWPDTHDAASYSAAWTADFNALLVHADAGSLLVRELYAVVADLREDLAGRGGGAYERGRAEGRDGVATWLERLSSVHEPATPHGLERVCFRCMAALALAVRKLGPCRPPLPPCAEAAEAERLRGALRGLVGPAEAASGVLADANSPGWAHDLLAALAAARAALGEGAG